MLAAADRPRAPAGVAGGTFDAEQCEPLRRHPDFGDEREASGVPSQQERLERAGQHIRGKLS